MGDEGGGNTPGSTENSKSDDTKESGDHCEHTENVHFLEEQCNSPTWTRGVFEFYLRKHWLATLVRPMVRGGEVVPAVAQSLPTSWSETDLGGGTDEGGGVDGRGAKGPAA